MTRPLIGITGSHDRATWDIWVDDVVLVPAAYTKAVERAGGQPVVIPPGDCDSSLVEKLDGLVVAGGADLNPGTYGEAPVPETADWRDRQDASERGLVAAVLERDLPLLGICRGLQLLAVMHGGRLHQHLPGTAGHEEHGGTGGTRASPASWARALPGIPATTRASPTPAPCESPDGRWTALSRRRSTLTGNSA